MITPCCLPQVSFQWLTHVQAAMSTLQKPGIGTFPFRFHPPKYASSLGWCNSNSTAAATSDRVMQEYLLHLSNPSREGTARSVLAALIIVVSNLCLPTPIGLLSRPVHAQHPPPRCSWFPITTLFVDTFQFTSTMPAPGALSSSTDGPPTSTSASQLPRQAVFLQRSCRTRFDAFFHRPISHAHGTPDDVPRQPTSRYASLQNNSVVGSLESAHVYFDVHQPLSTLTLQFCLFLPDGSTFAATPVDILPTSPIF